MRALAYPGMVILCTLLLSACQTQATKPGAPGSEDAGSEAASSRETAPGQQSAAEDAATAEADQQPEKDRKAAPAAGAEQLLESSRQVEQRITLMQEQVIRLNEQMTAVQQRNMQLLQAIQRLQMMLSQSAEQQPKAKIEDSVAPAQPTADLPENLADTLARLEQQLQNGAVATGFKLASAYTPKGQWVIFKYDEATGLTWKAEEGGWMEIGELESLPLSRYQVVLRPASGDVKGYVAARVDQETGRSWWLKGNTWEAFQ